MAFCEIKLVAQNPILAKGATGTMIADDPLEASQFPQTIHHRTGEWIGKIEKRWILDGAKVWRKKQFLRHDEVRAGGCRLADEVFMVIERLGLGGKCR